MKYSFDKIIDRESSGAIKYDARNQYFQKEDVIPMWIADMDFPSPPFVIEALQNRLKHPLLGYTMREEGFYRAIHFWLKNRHKWKVEREWIVFSPGIVPAISMAVLAYTNPDDKIIIQPPVYPPFFWCIANHKREIVENPLISDNGYYRMDFDALEKKASNGAKMLILCSPHNPVGRVWTEEELKELIRICKKYNILIISDEIHADLVFSPATHLPLPLVADGYDRIITCMAPSKTFNLAGLSTSAVIITDEKIRKEFVHIMETIHVGMGNIFGFVALEAAYLNGNEWLNELILYLERNIDFVSEFLARETPWIKFTRPESTYLLWLDCREMGMKDKELTDFFIQKAGIGPSPGSIFGKQGEGFQRINIASPLSVIKRAMEQLATAANS